MSIYAKVILALVAFGIVAGALFGANQRGLAQGRAEVQAKWDKADRDRARAETAAVLTRIKNNERIAEQQAINNAKIAKDHKNEITSIRAAYTSPFSLRLPSSICGGFAAGAKTEGPGGSDAAAAGTVALPEKINRDLQDLMQEADTVVANCRAAQTFIAANGLTP